LLREKVAAIPNVLAEPKVDVEILDFTLVGPVLAVRPYCHNDNYWQVYFDTNKYDSRGLGRGGFPGADAGSECDTYAIQLTPKPVANVLF
jgi:small conductance mechanosensitive channel